MPEFLTKVQLYKMHGRSPIWSIASSLLSFLELRESIKSSHNKFALHLYRDACMHAQSLQLYLTLWNLWAVVHQAPLSLGFSRQEYWSGLLCPPPGESSGPRDRIRVSRIASRFIYCLVYLENRQNFSFSVPKEKIKWLDINTENSDEMSLFAQNGLVSTCCSNVIMNSDFFYHFQNCLGLKCNHAVPLSQEHKFCPSLELRKGDQAFSLSETVVFLLIEFVFVSWAIP